MVTEGREVVKGRKYSTKNAGCVVVVAAAAAKREEEDGGGLGCEGVRAHARSCQKEEVAEEDGERASSLTPQLSLRRERERERPQQPLFSLSLRVRVHSTSSRGEESGGEDPGKKERRGKRVAGGVKGVRVSPEKGVCGVCSLSFCLVVGVFRCGGGKRAASKSAQTFLPPSLLRK